MDHTEAAKIILPVPPAVRDHLGKIAAERTRTTGQPASVAGLVREAVAAHFGIEVPTVSPHRRALRHRP